MKIGVSIFLKQHSRCISILFSHSYYHVSFINFINHIIFIIIIQMIGLVSQSFQLYGTGIPYGYNPYDIGGASYNPYLGGPIPSPYGIGIPSGGIFGSPTLNPYGGAISRVYPYGLGGAGYNIYGGGLPRGTNIGGYREIGGNSYGIGNPYANWLSRAQGPDDYSAGRNGGSQPSSGNGEDVDLFAALNLEDMIGKGEKGGGGIKPSSGNEQDVDLFVGLNLEDMIGKG